MINLYQGYCAHRIAMSNVHAMTQSIPTGVLCIKELDVLQSINCFTFRANKKLNHERCQYNTRTREISVCIHGILDKHNSIRRASETGLRPGLVGIRTLVEPNSNDLRTRVLKKSKSKKTLSKLKLYLKLDGIKIF